jgi:hypothetical protein
MIDGPAWKYRMGQTTMKDETMLPRIDCRMIAASLVGFLSVAVPMAATVVPSAPALADHYYDRDIVRFHHRDVAVWRAGYWHRGWHDGRRGWWWVAGGTWYYYPAPIYPYPDPYAPPTIVVRQAPPPPAPVVQGPPPTQFWYYCDRPAGYYPYVPTCPTAWHEVPAQASGSTSAPSAAQAPPPPTK